MLKNPGYIILIILSATCHAQEIPDYIPTGMSTSIVYTDTNQIASNPEVVEYINLSKQKLTSIPKIVFQCPNLLYLDLKRNKIEEIPPEINQLQKLRVLNLSRNRIARLPKEIGQLGKLKTLILNQNEIIELPPEIGLLSNLAVLDLWGNQLNKLPKEIERLSETLEYLDMRVIFMSRKAQAEIEAMLPETKIYFSQSCNCKD
jgi:Leucine-rich repeat (LRR) protein